MFNTAGEDLKALFRIAGVDNTPVTFLLVDTQLAAREDFTYVITAELPLTIYTIW